MFSFQTWFLPFVSHSTFFPFLHRRQYKALIIYNFGHRIQNNMDDSSTRRHAGVWRTLVITINTTKPIIHMSVNETKTVLHKIFYINNRISRPRRKKRQNHQKWQWQSQTSWNLAQKIRNEFFLVLVLVSYSTSCFTN